MNLKQKILMESDGTEAPTHSPHNSSFASDSCAIDGLDDPAELDGEADRAWREAMGRRLGERLMRERIMGEGVILPEEDKNALD